MPGVENLSKFRVPFDGTEHDKLIVGKSVRVSARRDDELPAKPRAINWKVVHRGSNAFGKHSARDCRASTRASIVPLPYFFTRESICISARAYVRFRVAFRAPISIPPEPNQTKGQTFDDLTFSSRPYETRRSYLQ